MRAHGRSLGVPPLRYKSVFGLGLHETPAAKLKFKAEWKRWRMAAIASAGEPRPPISPLQERLDWLGQVCELNLAQQYVLGLLARIARVPQVRSLVGAINEDDYEFRPIRLQRIATHLGCPVQTRGLIRERASVEVRIN